ncbi:hypothetical protein V8E55_010109 [Tylopilus felleus]
MSALCDQHDTFIHGSNIGSRRARIPQTYGTRDATIIDFHRALVTYSLVASTLLDHQGTFAMRSNIVIRRARSCSILPGDTAREMPDMTTTPSQHYLCYTRATFSTIRRTPFLMSIFVSRRVRAFKSPANEQTSRELLPSDGRHPLLLCSFRQSPRTFDEELFGTVLSCRELRQHRDGFMDDERLPSKVAPNERLSLINEEDKRAMGEFAE